MPDIIYISVMLFALALVVAAASHGRTALTACAVLLGVSSAVVAGKIVSVFGYQVSAATCLFAAIFLCTDVLSEAYGRRAALSAVAITFLANLSFLILGQLLIQIDPSQPTPVSEALDSLFEFLPRLMLGGLLAFAISQTLDVYIFEKMRAITGGKFLWLRNNASTAISQFIDTTVVWFVAFYGIIPDLWPIIFANYAVKLIAAAVDTPFCYLAVGLARRRSQDD